MEIMKLVPTGKDYLWGGTRLREEYGKKIDLTPLAETWECSVHPDGPSYIANGEFKGMALVDVLKQHPEYIGTKVEDGKLPVLVKFIDAKKDLSVQVHPSDDYAKKHEGGNRYTGQAFAEGGGTQRRYLFCACWHGAWNWKRDSGCRDSGKLQCYLSGL